MSDIMWGYDAWKTTEPPWEEDPRGYCPECDKEWSKCKCQEEDREMMDFQDWAESFEQAEDEESFKQWLDSLNAEQYAMNNGGDDACS